MLSPSNLEVLASARAGPALANAENQTVEASRTSTNVQTTVPPASSVQTEPVNNNDFNNEEELDEENLDYICDIFDYLRQPSSNFRTGSQAVATTEAIIIEDTKAVPFL